MDGLASFLMHRVDAARQLMHAPGRGAEASGRLFLAKRCHEAVKAGEDLGFRLPSIEQDVKQNLQPEARGGVEDEAEAIRRYLAAAATD